MSWKREFNNKHKTVPEYKMKQILAKIHSESVTEVQDLCFPL